MPDTTPPPLVPRRSLSARLAPKSGYGLVNLANFITLGRLCAVPMAVWLVLHEDFIPAFWLFAAAGISDGIDGWLARRNGPSRIGAMLDPVADKSLLVSMYVTLAAVRVLPDWLAILVVFRDAVIVGGVMVLFVLGQPPVIKPLAISKLNTVLQILLVGSVLLLTGLDMAAPWLRMTLIGLVAVSTFLSGAAYVWKAAHPT